MPKIDTDYLYNPSAERSTPSPELGQDAFLKILIAQIQNQDPMNPMEDKEFIAQMATFSQLEQMMKMNDSMNALIDSQLMSPVVKYSHMIDKQVTYKNDDGKIQEATVLAVKQKDGWAILELDNGEEVYADAIMKIKATNESEDQQQEETK